MMKKILNPFAYFDEKTLLIIGLIAHVFFTYIAKVTSSFFPDFLSIKKNGVAYSFIDLLYQNTRNVLVAIVLFYFFGKIINKRTRFIDIVNVILVSRIPIYFLLFMDFIPSINKTLEHVLEAVKTNHLEIIYQPENMFILMIVAFTALFLLGVMLYYLFIGFRTVTNMKSLLHIILFIAILFLIIVFTSLISLYTPITLTNL